MEFVPRVLSAACPAARAEVASAAKRAAGDTNLLRLAQVKKEPLRELCFSQTRAKAQKPGTDHGFLRARFSRQNRRGPARTPAFRPRNLPQPRFCWQNRRGSCFELLGIAKITGTYPNWSSKPSIPCRSGAPSLAIIWEEGSNKAV